MKSKSRDQKWIDLATQISKLSDHSRIRIGAAVVYKNELVAVGHNQNKTHPLQARYNVHRFRECKHALDYTSSLHAEMHTLIRAARELDDLSGCRMYVMRYNKEGIMAMARPCPACMEAILRSNIPEIIYSTPNGIATESLALCHKA